MPSSESAKTTPWELPRRDNVPGVTVVRDRKSAERALAALYKHKDAIFACDTEVADIDVKVQGPVGNGNVSKPGAGLAGGRGVIGRASAWMLESAY